MSCTLAHIPARLHTNERLDIPAFFVEEAIYRRAPVDTTGSPFSTLRLIDISVNRGGIPGVVPALSEPEDVLLNFNPEKPEHTIPGQIVTMRLKELDAEDTYSSSFSYVKPGDGLTYSCRLLLRHDKTSCNYSHCVFEVYFTDAQGEKMTTFDNYKETLGKHPKLQTSAKLALTAMIEREEIPVSIAQNADSSSQTQSTVTQPDSSAQNIAL